MIYISGMHNRRSIRLRHRNYCDAGAYFITICAQDRKCLFTVSATEPAELNHAGRMVGHWFYAIEEHFPATRCDAFIVMPNHNSFYYAEPKGGRTTLSPEHHPMI